jgi:hypothetical protein
MKRAIPLLTIALLLVGSVALAADGHDLSWHIITGGGGHSTGGDFHLDGGVVQPAGVMQGGDCQLVAGFWSFGAVAAVKALRVCLPVLLKGLTVP